MKNELFRATFGFDFVFALEDGRKKPYCIEINGEDSGLKAVESIPETDLDQNERERVKVRMTHTPERLKLSAYAESLDPSTPADARKEAWSKARSVPGFIHAFRNPPYIKAIVENKKMQQAYIPVEHRPLMYDKQGQTTSRTGYWICKPVTGRKGEGIKIVPHANILDFVRANTQQHYLIQEFIHVCGADKAPADMRENAAALRLLMDVIYLENGVIEEVFTFAYQRVSPYSPADKSITPQLENRCVVNVARGATAVAGSKDEYVSVHQVALQIIQNLAKGYREEVRDRSSQGIRMGKTAYHKGIAV